MPQETVRIISISKRENWASDADKARPDYRPTYKFEMKCKFPQISTFEVPSEVVPIYQELVGKQVLIFYEDHITKKGDNYRRIDPDTIPVVSE